MFASILSHVKCPLTGTHDWFTRAILTDTIDIHFVGADHEVIMGDAKVRAVGLKLLFRHLTAALHRKPIGSANGNMGSRILIKQRIVKQKATL